MTMAKLKSNGKRAAVSAPGGRRIYTRIKALTRRPVPRTLKGASARVCDLNSVIHRLNALRSKFRDTIAVKQPPKSNVSTTAVADAMCYLASQDQELAAIVRHAAAVHGTPKLPVDKRPTDQEVLETRRRGRDYLLSQLLPLLASQRGAALTNSNTGV
jgi:hypothetical protein